MDTLKIIQTLSKIGRDFSKVVFICCLVGFGGCVIGILSLGFGGEIFKLGGITIHSVIEGHSSMSMPTIYTTMVVGTVIVCSIGVSIADNFFPEIEKLSYPLWKVLNTKKKVEKL